MTVEIKKILEDPAGFVPTTKDYLKKVDECGLHFRSRKTTTKKTRYKNSWWYRVGPYKELIGSCDQISYKKALEIASDIAFAKATLGTPRKNTLQLISDEYLQSKMLSAATVKKHSHMLSSFGNYLNKSINTINKIQNIKECLNPLWASKKYAYLEDCFVMIRSILRYAKVHQIIKSSCLDGLRANDLWDIRGARLKEGKLNQYGWIDTEQDLKILLWYLPQIENKLFSACCYFGLLTGLRGMNVRTLTIENLKIDENGEYYLSFDRGEMKAKKGFDLGIPLNLAKILEAKETKRKENNQTDPRLFPIYGDNYMESVNKVLRPVNELFLSKPKASKNITFHSFRKIFSTFMNLKFSDKYSRNEIDICLAHTSNSIEETYNKASYIKLTRAIITDWIWYINSLNDSLKITPKTESQANLGIVKE